MLNLLRAEWFKLVRRPLTWVLLAVFLAFMLLMLSLAFLVVALSDGAFSEGTVRVEVLAPAQVEQFRRWLSLPGVFGAVFSQVNSIGGICAVILAAGALGSEYSWGTLRVQLARDPRRGRYLTAKLLALLLVLGAGIAIALLAGSLVGLLYGRVLGNTGAVEARDLLLLPLAMARALYVMLPYLLVTMACCALGRSVLAGAAGGLIFLSLDVSLGGLALFLNDNPALVFVYNLLLLQQNISTLAVLNTIGFGLDPAVLVRSLDLSLLPPPPQAALMVGLYSALLFGATYLWFTRRDITGPA